jgi:hypothetical protein
MMVGDLAITNWNRESALQPLSYNVFAFLNNVMKFS